MPITVIAAAMPGQSARPQFEVASIRPAGRPAPAMMRHRPGRVTANAPLRVLIQGAYDLQPFQVVSGPEWIGSESYVVDAKACGNPDGAQISLMLQSLLEDRFQLRAHREPREVPVYALVAGRGGLKLPPPWEESCVEDTDLLGPLAVPGARMQMPSQGAFLGDATPGLPAPPPGAIPVTASPSIFSALHQLGLRLESARASVDVLIIDHVERPSAN